jgi:Spy/CpxP family protein refolding chaperone
MKKLVFTIVCLLCLTDIAFAADVAAVEPSAAARFAGYALDILLPVMAALAGWLAMRCVRWLEQKLKIDISDKQEQKLNALIYEGVAYANEQARKKLKASEEKLKGPEKLELALNFAADMVEHYQLPAVSKEKLTKMVESKLNAYRPSSAKELSA